MDLDTAREKVAACHSRIGAGARKHPPWCSLFGSICATRAKQSITSPGSRCDECRIEGCGRSGQIDRGKRWYPLFEEELALVAKPNAKIISIGLTASKFLAEKGLHGHAGITGLSHAGKEIPTHEECWEKFRKDTEHFPTEVIKTLPRQKLVFDYMIRFERIRNQEETGWVARSHEWQRCLS